MNDTITLVIPASEMTNYNGIPWALERAVEKLTDGKAIRHIVRLLALIEVQKEQYEEEQRKKELEEEIAEKQKEREELEDDDE